MPEQSNEKHHSLHYPPLHSQAHAVLIGGSRERSQSFGLRELDAPDFTSIDTAQMKHMLEENRFLYQHAAPVMETLYHQIEYQFDHVSMVQFYDEFEFLYHLNNYVNLPLHPYYTLL